MLNGIGRARTAPDPLITLIQFVGLLATFRVLGAMNVYVAETPVGLLTTWLTFPPYFLWTFLGTQYIKGSRENPALSRGLSAVTPAVIGVILSLAIWFSLHTLFRLCAGVVPTLIGAAIGGAVYHHIANSA